MGIVRKGDVFSDEDDAMVEFGVGKNMVRAMRFWVEAAGLAQHDQQRGLKLTEIGAQVFGDGGVDRYMEDVQTLWLLHWNISTRVDSPLFAWEFLLNKWQDVDIKPSAVLKAFARESERLAQKVLSPVTLRQHFDVFVHTYIPTRGEKGQLADDNLDCPLTSLDLMVVAGETEGEGKRSEPIYAFRREDKTSIGMELFAWSICDFWVKRFGNNTTIPVGEVTFGLGSPGQTFKIPEQDIMRRLTDLEAVTRGALVLRDSHSHPHLEKTREIDPMGLLRAAYRAHIHA